MITIGVPVYNNDLLIGRALTSIKNQTHLNFKVLISDNASDDNTERICREFSENDDRFEYVRQTKNIGAFENFKFLVNLAETKYFVFLAADDYWEPRFLEENFRKFEINNLAVASISKVNFEKKGLYERASDGDYPIAGSVSERLNQYFSSCSDNSRFYSVFLTGSIRRAFENSPFFHALDWYIMALSLLEGEHVRVDEVLMHRESAPTEKYSRAVALDNEKYWTPESFPVLPLTIELFKRLKFNESLSIFDKLIYINFEKHKEYIKYKRPNSLYLRIISKIF